ncbi:MAG TPA: bifunctional UDP-N-acetylglucosamine diphosphorylase/glucosamine-1-phosphate N-acetyltransferase GlmU [Clostridia bacterium]|nr:bifunctional UDP-N-acetylglucosamine diphosphorylase/glucosamine-1-phosphate N-acetyltransferase GlmU [Clostridia bacterium]
MSLTAVILAAGKGTRMKSRLPKVMHPIHDKPMLVHVLDAARGAGVNRIIVVAGYGMEQVSAIVGDNVEIVVQEEQLGTAHALMQAEPLLKDTEGEVIVLCGDTPLIRPETLKRLVEIHRANDVPATLATMVLDSPTGYGRVLRGKDGGVQGIVEHRDATREEHGIKEVNAGLYCFNLKGLFRALKQVASDNVQGEYYLPDIIAIYNRTGRKVAALVVEDREEMLGVNDRKQLAVASAAIRNRILDELMLSGVTIVDPSSTFIEGCVSIGQDTVIHPFTFIRGNSKIGSECHIGPGSRLVSVAVDDRAVVRDSVVLESKIGESATVGPFAHIRPGTVIGKGVSVGDFVEIKNTVIEEGSKVPHLTYLGDTDVGKRVNVGAGTITCNYDGKNKFRTVIGDGAFIGSNANLVAPVEIGKGAVVAAGSTVTKDVPPEALGVARGKQKNIADWKKRKK